MPNMDWKKIAEDLYNELQREKSKSEPEEKYPTIEELKGAYREMEKLTDYILRRFPDEPGRDGRNESAADVAIRLMRQVRR